MQGLKVRLEEVLPILPSPSLATPYEGQDAVVFALDSIRADSKGAFDILENIVSRMGIDPAPFLPLFRDVSIRIIERIDIHLSPILPPQQLP